MATQTSSQDLNNLTINRVTSPQAFEQMISAGVISANEFYLVEGEDETVTWDNVTNKPSTFPPSSHSHGNITNTGTISTTAAIGNGDKLAIIDSSDSSKVTGSTISFDGSTATKALTQKGTWETFNNYSLTVATASALGGIKIGFQESANNYAVKLSNEQAYVTVPYATETSAGIVSASAQTFGGDKTFKSNKFYVYADEIRFRNKDASNNQSASNSWVTSLHIGDGEYVTLNEYKDDHLAIRSSSILLNTSTFNVYNASATYSVGTIVWYNKAYYICKTAIETAEEWNAEHWTAMPSAGVMSNANLTPWKTNTYALGSSAYRWSKLYVGTADTYGSTSRPIYWNAGVPTAITYSLNATINSGTAQYGIAYYSTTTNITSTAQGTNGALLTGKGANAPAWKASANGAVYATSANGDLQWGTLPIAQGGTGNTSYTANRLIYSESASKLSASGHYASSTKIAVNSTSEPTQNLYVNGTSYFQGLLTYASANANRIAWFNENKELVGSNHYADINHIAINSTTVPSYNLYVNGTSYHTDGIRIVRNGISADTEPDSILYIENKNSNDWGIKLNKDTTNYGLYIQSTGTELLQVGTNAVLKVHDHASDATSRRVNIVGRLDLNRFSNAAYGRISFYSPSYYTWIDYMSNAADGACPTGGKPGTLGNVTSWARRSIVENLANYGWTWEATSNEAASANTVQPTTVMALSSNNGQLTINGAAIPMLNLITSTAENSIYFESTDTNTAGRWAIGKRAWGVAGFGIGKVGTGSFISILDGGNVGIGTNSPSYKLHVAGDIYSTGWVRTASGFQLYAGSAWYGDFYINRLGTANSGDDNATRGVQGVTLLRVGNNIAWPAAGTAGGANNSTGLIRLYAENTYFTDIMSQGGVANRTFYLPNYNANMYAVHAGNNNAVGSATAPVYVAANGRVTQCSYNLEATVNSGTANYMAYYSGANAISQVSNLRVSTNGNLSIWPGGSSPNYSHGIRIHSLSNWSGILFCGDDCTTDTGTSANSWWVGNNNGTFYINKNGSTAAANTRAMATSTGWTFGNTSLNSYALNCASFICDSWIRTVGSTGWYNETYDGGWMMSDAKWIRSWHSKPVYIDIGSNNTYGIGTHRLALGLNGSNNVSLMLKGGSVMYGFAVNNNGYWYLGKRTTQLFEDATGDVYLFHGNENTIAPMEDNTMDFGFSNKRWKDIYMVTAHGALDGNAITSSYPQGFIGRSTGETWGNTVGTSITQWSTTNGGAVAWRYDNPQSGQASMKVDGTVYINEGQYPVLAQKTANGFPGFLITAETANHSQTVYNKGWNDSGWLRTTVNGFLPYQSGGASAGHSSLGTSTWYFANAYIQNAYLTNIQGRLTRAGVSSNWYDQRDNSMLYMSSVSGLSPGLTLKTTAGSWSISTYNNSTWNERLMFSYVTDTNYTNKNNTATTAVYITSAGVLMGAAWNDYAEYRETKEEIEPGRCVKEIGDDTLEITTKRLERGCEIVSDTYGFAIGETETCQTPIASSGRVLTYPYESREEFASHIGWPVCSGPNGTVSIMTEEEEEKYPSRIIGTISAVPDYEEWGTGNVKVNGRVWIRIR